MRLLTVIGARPQFIKAAPFSAVFRQQHKEILVHTGQHYDANMSDVFFNELGIPKPEYNLGVGSGNHGVQTGRMLEKIEELLLCEKPDGMLVYGDTNSTLAGALAASKLHIPVFHIEAGLRSFNMIMPEEQNRILTDHISTILSCPTQTAVDNLAREGITKGVHNTGDVMYDAVLYNIEIAKSRFSWDKLISDMHVLEGSVLNLTAKNYYLATVHRAENTDDKRRLCAIFEAFSEMDMPVLMPIHPRTRKLILQYDIIPTNVILIEPVGYLPMLMLTSNAKKVLTDSGGLQKEAWMLETPCVTIREQTEWIETLECGWNVLVHVNKEDILNKAMNTKPDINKRGNPFGDGHAAEKIVEVLKDYK